MSGSYTGTHVCENSPSSRLKTGALVERDSIEIVHVGIFTANGIYIKVDYIYNQLHW